RGIRGRRLDRTQPAQEPFSVVGRDLRIAPFFRLTGWRKVERSMSAPHCAFPRSHRCETMATAARISGLANCSVDRSVPADTPPTLSLYPLENALHDWFERSEW